MRRRRSSLPLRGRILYVAYQLEQLGETEAADRCRSAMHMEQIDARLLEFRNLCRSLDAGKILRVEFTHSAFRIVDKIRSLFDARPLGAILSQPLINRGTGLLLDFIGIATGWRNLEEFVPTDLNALIGDVVQAGQSDPHQDGSIIDHADDYERYLAALVLRIGHEPETHRAAIRFASTEGIPFVRIASARFSNTLLNFLEWLRQADPSSILIATGMEGAGPSITVNLPGRAGSLPTLGEEEKINSFDRRFILCGFVLKMEKDGFRLTLAEGESKRE